MAGHMSRSEMNDSLKWQQLEIESPTSLRPIDESDGRLSITSCSRWTIIIQKTALRACAEGHTWEEALTNYDTLTTGLSSKPELRLQIKPETNCKESWVINLIEFAPAL